MQEGNLLWRFESIIQDWSNFYLWMLGQHNSTTKKHSMTILVCYFSVRESVPQEQHRYITAVQSSLHHCLSCCVLELKSRRWNLVMVIHYHLDTSVSNMLIMLRTCISTEAVIAHTCTQTIKVNMWQQPGKEHIKTVHRKGHYVLYLMMTGCLFWCAPVWHTCTHPNTQPCASHLITKSVPLNLQSFSTTQRVLHWQSRIF